ncbi:MAG: DUF4351 domain-containing protein, partial [Magnetococcales bacterium]|nr:DUF4351 domain-containing protein [Magnetococcales bacterium]
DIRDDFTARGLKKAKEKLDVLQLPEVERRAYERYQDDLRDQASFVLSTYGAGKWEGRQEGRQEEAAHTLLRLLQKKMGSNIPEWVSKKLGVATLEEIETWTDRILDVQSLEDVFSNRA